jgi:hypothetical protein
VASEAGAAHVQAEDAGVGVVRPVACMALRPREAVGATPMPGHGRWSY